MDAVTGPDYSKFMPIRVSAVVMVSFWLLVPVTAAARGVKDAPPPVNGALGGALGAEMAPSVRIVPSLSSDDAAREIQRRHGGRVLSVQPDGQGYRVKVLKNGEVRIYQINP